MTFIAFAPSTPTGHPLVLPSFLSPSPSSSCRRRIPRTSFRTSSRGRNPLPTQMVFTGIVEEMGRITSLQNLGNEEGGVNLTVSANTTLEGVKLGDSISVNGACLTVTQLKHNTFEFGLAPETLRRTNLGDLNTGSFVNLERSLAADGRFGGHVVQGHVDCTGEILELKKEKDAIWFTIRLPDQFLKFIVSKGYVAVDGTSLTVCDVLDERNAFTFMMISFTQDHVVTASKSVGDKVNIEVDITGKYIERIMNARESQKVAAK